MRRTLRQRRMEDGPAPTMRLFLGRRPSTTGGHSPELDLEANDAPRENPWLIDPAGVLVAATGLLSKSKPAQDTFMEPQPLDSALARSVPCKHYAPGLPPSSARLATVRMIEGAASCHGYLPH
jgi:hypothetical protein